MRVGSAGTQSAASGTWQQTPKRLFLTDPLRVSAYDRARPQVALERLGLPASSSYITALQRQYDRDADGRVSFEDFASYVQKNEAKIWQAFRCALAPLPSPCVLGQLTHRSLVHRLRPYGDMQGEVSQVPCQPCDIRRSPAGLHGIVHACKGGNIM